LLLFLLLKFDLRSNGVTVENKIKWENQMDAALAKAQSQNDIILIDFFNPD